MPALTRAALLAEADRVEAEAAALTTYASELRRLAERAPLLPTGTIGTIGTTKMEAKSPSPGANISAAKIKGRIPFQRALIKRNLSLPEWAAAQKKPGAGGRRIPMAWAERIEREFVDENGVTEVPAKPASWPNGIRQDE